MQSEMELLPDSMIRPPDERSQRASIYERVMADDRSRHAYFNTTRGVLVGNPEHEETQRLRRDLNDRFVPHLFSSDRTLPQPVFYSDGIVGVGAKEITAWASQRVN